MKIGSYNIIYNYDVDTDAYLFLAVWIRTPLSRKFFHYDPLHRSRSQQVFLVSLQSAWGNSMMFRGEPRDLMLEASISI